ncbi:HAMP domain-containing protein [Waterburya agarophytonicola K14]|uniref:histidine kinase n=1 Tax=Waterburya agarophytonicola KI4 TaxID=2874699 RepID=A0A964BSU0_9CYAN|nr:ATP-binding protein [Waterburya agarophytonicola]MCC0178830.1 HAMP domain-containing protein [Waterburya agarophytonicola KI4]
MPILHILSTCIKLFERAKKSLRVRLTAWYVMLLGCTLIIFSSYLYLKLQSGLLRQVDTTLEVTTSEIVANLSVDRNSPHFKNTKPFQLHEQQLANSGFVGRIVDDNGKVVDSFGDRRIVNSFVPQQKGYQNLKLQTVVWRVYSIPLLLNNQDFAVAELNKSSASSEQLWLQIAQSLNPITQTLKHLLLLMLFGFPVVLLLAGFGGLFLADRALNPIAGIIRTAEAIDCDDLSYRINYQGKTDEVGRLAMTLDRMLDRIELAFEHERRFIADASHELRTPLAVIKGQIGVALSLQRTPGEYKATLQDLESHTDRLIRLTNGLLFLARLEQKQSNFVEVNLTDLLEVLIEQIQFLAEERHIDLKVKIIPNLLIWGDCDLLTSLFLNLLDNAVKYTPVDGQIQFETKLDYQKISISISNTGRGIAEQDLAHIFDRFYRLDRDRHTQGSGLGLAIAALIVRCHRGQISATSQIDKLTTFEVDLPISTIKSSPTARFRS